MKTELKVNKWEILEGKIAGSYKMMIGQQEIATQRFNDGYGSADIEFDRELQDEVDQIAVKIEKSIIKSFGG